MANRSTGTLRRVDKERLPSEFICDRCQLLCALSDRHWDYDGKGYYCPECAEYSR